jgi:histidyl-tRNA synthetase
MKRADRLGASYVLIVGDKELEERTAILRNMATKEQKSVALDNVIENIKQILYP